MFMIPSPAQSVLIVDDSPETREVLRTALNLRGVRTLEASESHEGLDLLRLHRPNVVVLDAEMEGAADEFFRAEWDEEVHSQATSLIVLGKARWCASGLPHDQVVPKPYHYGPLVRKIEQLCQQARSAGGAP